MRMRNVMTSSLTMMIILGALLLLVVVVLVVDATPQCETIGRCVPKSCKKWRRGERECEANGGAEVLRVVNEKKNKCKRVCKGEKTTQRGTVKRLKYVTKRDVQWNMNRHFVWTCTVCAYIAE